MFIVADDLLNNSEPSVALATSVDKEGTWSRPLLLRIS